VPGMVLLLQERPSDWHCRLGWICSGGLKLKVPILKQGRKGADEISLAGQFE
jgi:hypothetical protein